MDQHLPDRSPTSRRLQVPRDDVRVRDDERRRTDRRLQVAVGDGSLDLREYEERARSVWAARTRGELAAAVVDLPPLSPRDLLRGAAGPGVRTSSSAARTTARRLAATAAVAAFLAAGATQARAAEIVLRDLLRGGA